MACWKHATQSWDQCYKAIYKILTSVSDWVQGKQNFCLDTSNYHQNIATHKLNFKYIPNFLHYLILVEHSTNCEELHLWNCKRNIFQAHLGVTQRLDIPTSQATVEREPKQNLPDTLCHRHHDFYCFIFHSLITIYKYVRKTMIIKMLYFHRDHTLKTKLTKHFTKLAHGIPIFQCNFVSWGPSYWAVISLIWVRFKKLKCSRTKCATD